MFKFAHERWKRAPDTSGEWEGSSGAGHGSLCVAPRRNNQRKMSCITSLGAQALMTTYVLFSMGCVAQKVSWHLLAPKNNSQALHSTPFDCRAHSYGENRATNSACKSRYSTIVCFLVSIIDSKGLEAICCQKNEVPPFVSAYLDWTKQHLCKLHLKFKSSSSIVLIVLYNKDTVDRSRRK